ncbi:unnamed protein product [Boreogadus saida]
MAGRIRSDADWLPCSIGVPGQHETGRAVKAIIDHETKNGYHSKTPSHRQQAAAATRTRILQGLRETDLVVSEPAGAPTPKKLKSIGKHDEISFRTYHGFLDSCCPQEMAAVKDYFEKRLP